MSKSPGSSGAFNKECPICLTEDKKGMWKLDCNHCAHLECLKGMNKLVCPMCRADIKNLPLEINQNIENNHDNYQRERDAEYDRMIGRMAEEEGANRVARITLEGEIRLALQYLVSLGIPPERLPSINMEIYNSGPLPPQGAVYHTIVTNTINQIQQELDQDLVEEEEEDEDDEESESGSEEEVIELRNLRPLSISEFLGALAGASMLSTLRRN